MIVNLTNDTITLPKGTPVAYATATTEDELNNLFQVDEVESFYQERLR
jgi:hypothetical protein